MKGDQIRDMREKLEFTQTEFANTLGISFSTISRWEQGNKSPNFKQNELLETLYNIVSHDGINLENIIRVLRAGGIIALTTLAASQADIKFTTALGGVISATVKAELKLIN